MRSILAILGGAGCLCAAGWPAAAQSVRVQAGDLSTPEAVRAFDERIDAAARRFCHAHHVPSDLDGFAGCKQGVRAEALAQLSEAERQAYAEAKKPRTTAASR